MVTRSDNLARRGLVVMLVMRWSRIPFLLVAVAGCGKGEPTTEFACSPACLPGTHCTESGCMEDTPGAADLSVALSGDLAGGDGGACIPPCAAPTPVCSPSGRCVACLADEHC